MEQTSPNPKQKKQTKENKMKTLKTPMTPVQKRLKTANSIAHKPLIGTSVKPLKPAKPKYVKPLGK